MRFLGVVLTMVLLASTGWAGMGVPDNVKLTVVTAPQGKEDQSRKTVNAEAVVTRINTSEQLKALALELLAQLKSTYRDCRSFTVVLSNDARMMKIGNYLAIATCKDEKTEVTGGIPTYMDLRVMRASKVDVRKPDELGMQVAYEVARLKKEAAKNGKTLPDDKVYALVAKKHKLQAAQVRQIDRGITQYYKAFAGKTF